MTPSQPSFSLKGDVVIVTGAAGHLGRAMTLALCEAGATVYANGRSEPKIMALVSELGAKGHDIRPFCFDIRDDNAITDAFERLANEVEQLDVLVNNAYASWNVSASHATRRDYLEAYDMTVGSAAALVSAATELLSRAAKAKGSSSVVNIATMYATVSPDPRVYEDIPGNPPNYGPAKAGLLQWTRYMACHMGSCGIRFNSISPGPFPNAKVVVDNPEFAGRLAQKTPLGRIGEAGDIGGPTVFLASRASAYVTGINIPVDGGWTAW